MRSSSIGRCAGGMTLCGLLWLGCQVPPAGNQAEREAQVEPPATQEAAKPRPRRETITPPQYSVDHYGFTPVDRALQKAFAREEMIEDDAEGALNPYVLKVISAYPLDGSYPYHCSWDPWEYDIYNGVTQDLWYKGRVVAKAYPDGSRCSYCCGLTFEIFVRAMQLRNVQKGLDPDDFNGMSFHDLFNLLQLWYIEGKGDSPQRGIVAYGLGRAIEDWEDARPGDFCDYSSAPRGGHSVIFIDWIRDADKKIIGMKYFSSNLSGTKGAGYGEGLFADSNNGRGLLRKWTRLARVGSIANYKSFDRLQVPLRNAYAPVQPWPRAVESHGESAAGGS
ncbi:MAG: hypothetical protein GXY55_11010 [Phycisphaerae bacterium]|nr:hypothetical protein [Phycisphaerae bacterium]